MFLMLYEVGVYADLWNFLHIYTIYDLILKHKGILFT